MGRHAAPNEDDSSAVVAPALLIPPPPGLPVDVSAIRPPGSRPQPQPRGRHAVDDDDDDVVVAVVSKPENASQADLRLLRTDPALRNRVIAAVVVPFVLYLVVLLTIGRVDAFAVWVWLPMITAGVTGGLLLDTAHKRQR